MPLTFAGRVENVVTAENPAREAFGETADYYADKAAHGISSVIGGIVGAAIGSRVGAPTIGMELGQVAFGFIGETLNGDWAKEAAQSVYDGPSQQQPNTSLGNWGNVPGFGSGSVNIEVPDGYFGNRVPPILLDLSDDGFQLIDLSESAAFFDYDADSYLENIGWVSGDDGILSIDLNGSGKIDDASEFVFAGETEAEDTDLEALAELYDSNGDGVLNAEDEAWAGFRVWQDWNGDGQSQEGEVSTLEELNITEVGLVSDGVEEEIAGNIVHGRATFTREDGTTGDVGDVSFRASSYGYRETEDGIEIGDGNTLIVEGDDDQNRDLADSVYDGLITGAGDDTLLNSSGEDGYLSSGAGNDTLSGDAGDDTILGQQGDDTLLGGDGNDILSGGSGDDTL